MMTHFYRIGALAVLLLEISFPLRAQSSAPAGSAMKALSAATGNSTEAPVTAPSPLQPAPSAEDVQIRQVVYSYKGTKTVQQIWLDAKARAALAARPIEAGETGEKLIEDLEERGGYLQDVKKPDGTLVPGEQNFDERNGKRSSIIYYRAGKTQDPAPGVAAVQGFDSKSGAPVYTFYFTNGEKQNPSPDVPATTEINDFVTVYQNYQAGKLEDPLPGKPGRSCVNKKGKLVWEGHYRNDKLQDIDGAPAWQEFDPTTGHLTLLEHCKDGLFEDTADGEPARQNYDAATGALVSAASCSQGKTIRQLDATELAALAERKHVPVKKAK